MIKKSPKILQIFNRYLEYGGEEGSVPRIANVLKKVGRVTLYEGSTEKILERPGGKYLMPFLMQKNSKVLADLEAIHNREKFDVWQVHNVFPGLSVAVYELAAKLGVPVIQYLHNYRFGCASATYFRDGKVCVECRPDCFAPAIKHRCWRGSLLATASMVAALKRFWKAGGIENIKAFIALSETQKKMHVNMGLPEEKIHVLQHFLEDGEQDSADPPTDGDVLYIGRLTEEKGAALLIRCWARVDSKGRRLRIVGKGEASDDLKKLVEEEKIDNVIFEGFVPKEKQISLWNEASFFVAPSVWNEPFGMVVLEAWKQSRPVLATRLGSYPDLITDGEDGWLADPDDESFAEALQVALDSSAECKRMGRVGRCKLLREYSESKWLDGWLNIYKEAIGSEGQ